jgi:surface-anchored protein
MKTQTQQHNGHIRLLGLAALMATGLTLQAQTQISSGHVDIGIGYNSGWDLHVHDEENDIEYEPGDALFFVGNVAYNGGSSTWILPTTENPNLPFIGLATEETAPGLFQGDQITLSLKGVAGPGAFTLYSEDEFAVRTVLMNSADGFLSDSLTLAAGTHAHYFWEFSAAGDYTLTFESAGTLVGDIDPLFSGNVDYLFTVEAVPEPSTFALTGLGLAALVVFRRRHA